MSALWVPIVAVASVPSLRQRVDGKLVARDFPITAADFVVQHPPPGHMLNVYGWGGHLIYRVYGQTPPHPVLIFGDSAHRGAQLLHKSDHCQYAGTTPSKPCERY